MDADRERGQSVLELLFVVPVFLFLAALLVKVSIAIQVAIVNQKYARSHVLWLAFNSPVYPEVQFRKEFKGYDRMIMGVSDNIVQTGGQQSFSVKQSIVRPGQQEGSNDDVSEPDYRGVVRVRSTVSLCTGHNLGEGEKINEGYQMAFCRSPVE